MQFSNPDDQIPHDDNHLVTIHKKDLHVFFLQNTLRPAQKLKGKTKMQIASARIKTQGTYECFLKSNLMEFFCVSAWSSKLASTRRNQTRTGEEGLKEQIKPLSLPKLKSVKVLACLKGWTVVKLPMDLISADHTAEVRSSTAGSFNIYSVQSFGWTKVPITC